MIINKKKKISLQENSYVTRKARKNAESKKNVEPKTIYCLIGPSASGKTTLIKENKDALNLGEIVSTTTRQPRAGEINGRDYNFVSKNEFNQLQMVEKDEYAGDYYGTSLNSIYDSINEKSGTLTAITFEGYENIKQYIKVKNIKDLNVVSIFVNAPQYILEERMQERGDTQENIQKRLNNIKNRHEYDNMFKTDYIFIPDSTSKYRTNEKFCNLLNYYKYGQQFFENSDFAIENTASMHKYMKENIEGLKNVENSYIVISELYKRGIVSLKDLSQYCYEDIDDIENKIDKLEKLGICYVFSKEVNVFTHETAISASLTSKGEILAKTEYLKSIADLNLSKNLNNQNVKNIVEFDMEK